MWERGPPRELPFGLAAICKTSVGAICNRECADLLLRFHITAQQLIYAGLIPLAL